ncbi:methyl-accepting chemotaxis protein [Actinoplanes couchii]|nr:methyl-accepting chemotaxis protein [Actinoplanes couchii]MDR6318273.1 methyl-accepting chemotaxis protein [Actinoplanes couchii]
MRTKLGLLVAVPLAGLVVSTTVGVSGLLTANDSARELQTAAQLTRTALEADMAHDAIRGDVLRALFSRDGTDRTEGAGELTEHIAAMRAKLDALDDPRAPAAVRAATERVTPTVEEYLRIADTVVDTPAGSARGAAYQQFTAAFTAVEEQLPAVGDALDAHAAATTTAVAEQGRRAIWQLGLTAGFAVVLLLGLVTVVSRGILSSLRQVSTVLSAAAGGDLSQRAAVTGRDEFADMGGQVNTVIAGMRETIAALTESAATVADSTGRMTTVSQRISAAAERATGHAGTTSTAAEAVSRNITTTAAANEQMGASITEIARSTTDAVQVVAEAVAMAEQANQIMTQLGESSAEIGDVVKVITSIAEQTNLLALNATIEAARAGELGKGFAVVAGEVKDLAQETATATRDISTRVEAIQAGAGGAIRAINEITAVIQRINDLQTTIASAIEQQSATAAEMTRNMGEAAGRSTEITRAIGTVADDASTTAQDAQAALSAAHDLAGMTNQLHALAAKFRT